MASTQNWARSGTRVQPRKNHKFDIIKRKTKNKKNKNTNESKKWNTIKMKNVPIDKINCTCVRTTVEWYNECILKLLWFVRFDDFWNNFYKFFSLISILCFFCACFPKPCACAYVKSGYFEPFDHQILVFRNKFDFRL